MFEGFNRQADPGARRRFALSTGISLGIYALIGTGALFVAGATKPATKEDKIDVVFRPPPEAPKPSEPPPPPPIVKKRSPLAPPAPVAAAVAPPPLPEPKISDKRHAEADASKSEPPPRASAPPTGGGVPGGQPGGEGTGAGGGALDDDDEPPPPPKVSRNVPINLPEDAEPPEPDEGNEQPECPEGVRSTGVAMTVVLKIVINEKGYVDKIDVMKGDAALIQPVISAVRKWHYSPAMLDGKPLTVYKIVKVTCKP